MSTTVWSQSTVVMCASEMYVGSGRRWDMNVIKVHFYLASYLDFEDSSGSACGPLCSESAPRSIILSLVTLRAL